MVANNYLQSEKDSGSWAREMVGALKTGDLAQIEEKGYARPYEADKRKLFKVGTVFSSETGTICEFTVRDETPLITA